MLINFFMTLRSERLPVTLTELFSLLECLEHNLAFADVDAFYHLSRLCMVKDEKHFDKFDRAFSRYFDRVEQLDEMFQYRIPEHWLQKQFVASLSEEYKARIEAMG